MSELGFFYDFSSPYAYFAAAEVEAVAARTGARLVWRPFFLGGLFKTLGLAGAPIERFPEAKRRYYFEDFARTASFLGLAGIPETAETVALARDLLLVEQSGVRAHFSQLTSARGAALIAQAQARGLPVTADVALYQLILTDEALIDFSSLYHVQPPLRTRADRDGLREAVKSGVIQAISSHHQPHERDAKLAPFAATEPGISSVELLLPLALTLVEDGLLDLPTLLARLSSGPAQAMRIAAGELKVGAAADIVLFDRNASTVAGENWLSKGQNSPFLGHCLPGAVRHTLMDGHFSFGG